MNGDSMIVSVSAQCAIFLRACLCGAMLALFCDLFRILRRAFRFPIALVAVQDFFCCIVFCVASFLFLLSQCNGRLRWFAFVGELLGATLYWALLGEIIVGIGAWVLRQAARILAWLFGLIKKPFSFLWRIILRLFSALRSVLSSCKKTSKRILKKVPKE